MNYRYVSHLLITCTIATVCPLRTLAAPPSSVVLSEIQWGGSPASTADEWIELANHSSEPQNIGSWQIVGIASQGAAITIPETTLVAGQGTYLIANYQQGDSKTTLNVPADLVTSAISIPNGNIAIALLDASGNVMDSFTDSGTLDTGSTSPFASSERDLATDVWHTATANSNLTDPAMYATPGQADFPIAVTPTDITDTTSLTEIVPTSEIQTLIPENTDIETIEASADTTEITDPIAKHTEIIEDTTEATIDEEVINVAENTNTDAVEQEIITLITPITSTVITESVVPVENKTDATEKEGATTTLTSTQTVTRTLNYGALRVSEFLSSPAEGNEWVELWNSGTESLDLSYVELVDASGKKTVLEGTLSGNAYLLIEAPAGKLNNDKDSVMLKLTDGQTAFSLSYGTATFPTPKKGFSAGVCADGWHTTLVPSAGTANTCPSPSSLNNSPYETTTTPAANDAALNSTHSAPATAPSVQGSAPTTASQNGPDHLVPITASVITDAVSTEAPASQETEEAREASDDAIPATRTPTSSKKISSSKSTLLSIPSKLLDEVTSGQVIETTGTVAVAPGLLGKRIAYLNGVQLYFHKALWPVLEAGDRVRIQGTWDNENGNRRIKIAQAEDITILGSEELFPNTLSDIPETSLADILATATGMLAKKDAEAFVFTMENGTEFHVMDKGKTGALGDARAGETYRIVGMRIPLDGVWTLIPRSTEDVTLIPTTTPDGTGGKFSAPTTPQPSTSLGAGTLPPSSSATPIVGGGILASSVGALGYWLVRSRKLSFLFSPS